MAARQVLPKLAWLGDSGNGSRMSGRDKIRNFMVVGAADEARARQPQNATRSLVGENVQRGFCDSDQGKCPEESEWPSSLG